MRTMLLPFALTVALFATGCNRGETPPLSESDPLQLRTYAVPADRTTQVAEALNTVLSAGEGQRPIGRASWHVPGKVPVLAPMSMHASIRKSIDDLTGGAPSEASGPRTVRMRYWLIDAVHAGGDDGAGLAAVAPALDAARATIGAAHFELVDYGDGLVSANAERGVVSTGQRNEFMTVLRSGGGEGRLRAEIGIVQRGVGNEMLTTTIDVVPGQFLILAQVMTTPATGDMAARSRLVVVQAQPLQPD